MTLDKKDLLLILDYVDGRLSTQEMVGLELRFTNEPELSRAYESFDKADELQRQTNRARIHRRPMRMLPGRSSTRAVAAAALLLLAAGLFLTRESANRLSAEFALVPSGVEWADFNRALDLGEEWSRRTPTSLRGSNEPEFPHREYFDLAEPIQEQRLERALSKPAAPGPMGYFNAVLRPESDCSAVVLIADAAGRVMDHEGGPDAPAFPMGSPWTAESGRLEGGRLEVLPRRNLVWNENDGRVEAYAPGFLVPRQAVQLEVLVGLRARPLDAQLEESLNTLLKGLADGPTSAQATSRELRNWLDGHGFDLISTTVEEAED